MGKTRNRRSFWNRNLSAEKVGIVLSRMGVDPVRFQREYSATRKRRTMRPLSEKLTSAELKVVKSFREHGNVAEVAKRLNRSVTGASSLIARAVAEGIL